jgi:hypothetical protein
MRFTSFIVAGIFAVAASAQSSTAAAGSTSVASSDPAQSSVASEIEQCLAKCDAVDTRCRANCIAVPSPDDQNVNETTKCVADCPQGNGTAADNQAYSDCVATCIGQYYYTTTGTPNLATSKAGGDSDGSASVTQIATTITSGGSTIVTSFASTATKDSNGPASTSSSDGAAAVYGPVGSGLGLFGLLAAFAAL